jgi:DNA-binding NarL/FixJ family response regulator
MRNPSRVLVVDDYEQFRRFLRLKLESRPELQIVGEASDGLQAIQKGRELQPDLILLDVGLPTINGLEVARRITRLVPAARILFISQNDDVDVVATVLAEGAKGYIRKENANRDVLPAVEAVLRGRRFVSRELCCDGQPPTLNLTLGSIRASVASERG